MRTLGFLLTAALLTTTAHAEVFRCLGSDGKTLYQPTPCQGKGKEEQLDIRRDPEKEAAAKAKLQAIQTEYDTRRLEQQKKAQEEQQKQKEQEVNMMQLSIQRQQAEASERQALALERLTQGASRQLPYYTLPVPLHPNKPLYPSPTPQIPYAQQPHPAHPINPPSQPSPGSGQLFGRR